MKPVKATPAEQKIVNRRMRKKYPQMFDSMGQLKKSYGGKGITTARTEAVQTKLKGAGLSDAAIARLRGTKK